VNDVLPIDTGAVAHFIWRTIPLPGPDPNMR
jgi:hypothetical protein